MDGPAALISLASSLQANELPPEQVCQHVIDAVKDWLNGMPIDRALDIKPADHAYQARDNALRCAAELLGNDPSELALQIKHFSTRTLPRWKGQPPPPTASTLEHHLHAAFKAGVLVPESSRHLRRIVCDKNRGIPLSPGVTGE